MSQNGRPGVILPGQVGIRTSYMRGPLADPSTIQIQSQDGVNLVAVGGMTKLEKVATEIASTLAMGVDEEWDPHLFADAVAERSVEIANAILKRCHEVQNGSADPSPQNQDDQKAQAGGEDNRGDLSDPGGE